MPEVVQAGQGNLGSNPSGVGAVIFDSTVDPLQAHFKNLELADQALQRNRQAQQQKTKMLYDLVGDLDPNVKGIMDTDAEYFRQRGRDLQDAISAMYKMGDPSNPAFVQLYSKAEGLKKAMEIDAQSSAAQKQIMMDAVKEYQQNPDKYDDASLQNLAKYRSAAFNDRQKLSADLLVPQAQNLEQLTLGLLGKEKLEKKNVPIDKSGRLYSVKTDPSGHDIMTTRTETIPLGDAANLYQSFNKDRAWNRAFNNDWSQIQGTPTEQHYIDKMNEYKAQGLPVLTPKDAFGVEQIYNHNQVDKDPKDLGESPYVKNSLSTAKKKQAAQGLYDDVVKIFAGSPDAIAKNYIRSSRTYNIIGTGEPVVKVDETHFKNAKTNEPVTGDQVEQTRVPLPMANKYNGRPLGEYEYTVPIKDSSGKVIGSQTKHAPDIIEGMVRFNNGNVAVITSKTNNDYKNGTSPYPWGDKVFQTPYELATALAITSSKDEKDAAAADEQLGYLQEVERDRRSKYGTNYRAMAGMNAQQIQSSDQLLQDVYSPQQGAQQPAQQQSTTKRNIGL